MRHLVIVLIACLLGACGFQLRGEAELPETISPLRIESVDAFSRLPQDLGRAMQRAGVAVTEGEAAARLLLVRDQLVSRPQAIGGSGRAQEYTLSYEVEFELTAADGEVLAPRQSVELSRDFSFDANETLGSPGEEDVVRRELQREMVPAVLRRIEAALR